FRFCNYLELVLPRDFRVRKGLQEIVDIVAPQVRVAVGGQNLINVPLPCGDELEDGDVERSAAQIVNGDLATLLFVQAVGERRGGWFVHQRKALQARELAGVLGRLALGVVEISGHGDNRTVDSFAEMRFGPVLELPQDEGRNLGRGEELVAQTNPNDIPARGIN